MKLYGLYHYGVLKNVFTSTDDMWEYLESFLIFTEKNLRDSAWVIVEGKFAAKKTKKKGTNKT